MVKGLRGSVLFGRGVLAVSAFTALCLLAASPAEAAVGRTSGSFAVTAGGAATYTIPIFTPPGPHGVQPSVALAYNSDAGVGYLGKGWTLAGFSAISRCGKTLAQDGSAAPIYGSYYVDAYCLNGNRLRVQTGSYGVSGSTYFTEIADFSLISAAGVYDMPSLWTVKRKDGLIETYGGSSDSNLPTAYMLSEIADRSGNKVKYTWKVPDTTTSTITHPVQIQWTQTGHNSGSYVYSMDFTYGTGSNSAGSTLSGYIASGEILESDLLNTITVSVSGDAVRKYELTYETSPTTGAKRLHVISECAKKPADTSWDCLSDTTITYQDGSAGFSTSTTWSLSGNITSVKGQYDFNGDGIKDLAYFKVDTWYVRMGSITGYGSEYSTGLGYFFGVGKILGNRLDQFLSLNSSSNWAAYTWNGSGFTEVSTGVSMLDIGDWYGSLLLMDVNGDHLDDLVYLKSIDTNASEAIGNPYYWFPEMEIEVRLNQSDGTYASFSNAYTSWSNWYEMAPPEFWMYNGFFYWFEQYFTSISLTKGDDIDGDGRDEMYLEFTTNWWGEEPTGTQAGSTSPVRRLLTFDDSLQHYAIDMGNVSSAGEDFDGDGCNDLLSPFGGGAGAWVGISSCSTWSVGAWLDGSTLGGSGSFMIGAADWNGDKRKDFILQDGSTLYVRPLLGHNTLGTLTSTGITVSGTCGFFRTDGNGDGLDDIGCLNPGSGFTVYFHNGTNIQPDLATQFTDGFGVNQTATYTAIARGDAYTPNTSAAAPPIADVVDGHTVVSRVDSTDGVGGNYHIDYQYFGGLNDLLGRGFVGFQKVESMDSRTGTIKKHVQKFSQTYPYIGMLIEDSFYQSVSGPLVSKTTFSLDKHDLSTTAYNERVFPYVTSVVEEGYEVGGSSDGLQIVQATTSNSVDTWGNLTTSSREVIDKDVYSGQHDEMWTTATAYTFDAYSTDRTNYWCLGLPTETSVTQSSTVSGETSVIRSKTFTPNYEKCRNTAESVGSGALLVQTDYSYDDFGNVDEVSVTGQTPSGGGSTAMTARTSTITWGSAAGTAGGTGQFPVTEENALGQQSHRTFDPTFGSLLTDTDPNSIVVASNSYDSFGRVSRTDRPDGTATTVQYLYCSTYSSCINTNNILEIATFELGVGDTFIRDESSYVDLFGRTIGSASRTMDGHYSRSYQEYDTLGRVAQVSTPCAWSSGGSCAQFWVTNTYDLLGRITGQSRKESQNTLASTISTTISYEGRKQTITDPKGKLTTKIADVVGQLRSTEDDDSYKISFKYDAAGSLLKVSDSPTSDLFTAEYSYGIKPFQTETTDTDLGHWEYTYDSLGELVKWTDAQSHDFSQTYDVLSRVTSREDHDEGITAYWAWDANTDTGCTAGDVGQLISASRSGYQEKFCYDSLGRIKKRTITTDQPYDIDFAYNNEGALDTLTYPESTYSTRLKVKYGYAYGVLQSVTDWTTGSAGTVYYTANSQNARGQTTQETLGNGVVTNRDFDAVSGQLNYIQSGTSGGGFTSLQNLSYAYDAVGNVIQRQESTLGLTEDFCYDDLHRLKKIRLGGSGIDCYGAQVEINYAANGNITGRTDVNGGATWNYATGRKHALTSIDAGGGNAAISYEYDSNSTGNGNMTKRNGSNITWSSYNYPTSLATGTESTVLSYGPDRQYYKQIYYGASTETTYYVGGLLEKVIVGSATDWRHSIAADGQVVAIVSRSTSGNAVYYPLEDNQGSNSVITSSSGTNLVRQSYAAFGLPRDGSDWDGSVPSGDQSTVNGIARRGYTGHSMLGDMGLIHMNGRVQDAVTGRFLSPDPYVFNPRFTQSFNRYSYVSNNPLSFIDPSGFQIVQNCSYYQEFQTWYDTYITWGNDGSASVRAFPYQLATGGSVRKCFPVEIPDDTADPASAQDTTAARIQRTGARPAANTRPPLPQTRIPCRPGVYCYAKPITLGTRCMRSVNAQLFSDPAYQARVNEMMDLSMNRKPWPLEYAFMANAPTGQIGPVFTSNDYHINNEDVLGPNGAPFPQTPSDKNKNLVFTHAHPPPGAPWLSDPDLENAIYFRYTIVAVDPNYNLDCADQGRK